MSGAVEIVALQLSEGVQDLAIHDQTDMKAKCTAVAEFNQEGCDTNSITAGIHHGDCAICLDKIVLQETALVKGCEHAYCVTCILRWASCKKEPTCPQCKYPFEFLNIHRGLDGRIHDYMFEESVCLLLRASWFKPLVVFEQEDSITLDDLELESEDYYYYEEEEDDPEYAYLSSSSSLRIGNRRWGDNGYVRSGRQEARPVHNRSNIDDTGASSSSRQHKKKDNNNNSNPSKEVVGRRAKRAMKREAADKAAAAKHQNHLARFGRK